MQVSYSRVECFNQCPRKWKLHYIDEIQTLPSDSPTNALILGTAIHRTIETNSDTAIKEYYMSYPVITDEHTAEALKIEIIGNKAKEMLPEGQHEVKIETEEYKGFIDLLAPNDDGTYDIYDFKYSNNVDAYMKSSQLHVYKYYAEQVGYKIKNLFFVFIPKLTTGEFYEIPELLDKMTPIIRKVDYSDTKLKEWLDKKDRMLQATEYPMNPSALCRFCEYNKICDLTSQEMEENYMIQLPSSAPRAVNGSRNRKFWFYGNPFSGKSTLVSKAPKPFCINTDGNLKFLPTPFLLVKDEVIMNGRIPTTKYGWLTFKEIITELNKKNNDFQTIVIDLVEDLREMCRTYMYDKLKIKHESEAAFGKAWDMIKKEYLDTLKSFFNLDYENLVLISHAQTKDVKNRVGDTVTSISPNIQEALANKIAGMCDIVARVNVEPDDSRTLNFKYDEYIFGGGRLSGIQKSKIPLEWSELMKEYENIVKATKEVKNG